MENKSFLSDKDKVECSWNDSVFYIEPKIFFEALFLQSGTIWSKPWCVYKTCQGRRSGS